MVIPLVLDLQRDAMGRKVSVSDLLRKAVVVAHKLGLKGFEDFAQRELTGYTEDDTFPQYRKLNGTVVALNPLHGWRPVIVGSSDTDAWLSTHHNGQSIPEIEYVLDTGTEDSVPVAPFSPEVTRKLQDGIGRPVPVTLQVPRNELFRITDAVRTIVLNWTLELESKKVLGEDMTFTPEEKEKAGATAGIANHFFGPVSGLVIQQGRDNSFVVSVDMDLTGVAEFVAAMRAGLAEFGLDDVAGAELTADLDTLDAQLKSPSPKKRVVRELLASFRSVLEGAGGQVAGTLLAKLAGLS